MNNTKPTIPAVGSVWRFRQKYKLRVICNDCRGPYQIVGLKSEDGREFTAMLNLTEFHEWCAPWTESPAVGTLEWAESLPVGSRVRHESWLKTECIIRHREGWVFNRFGSSHVQGISQWCQHPTGWSLVTTPIITDWPKWAKAAAMDKGGSWFWYESKPNSSNNFWMTTNHFTKFHPTEIPDWSGDWRNSLVVKGEK